MNDEYKGVCFCGQVEFEAAGAPAIMGYCHCEDCKSWSAAPINAFSLWAPDNVRIYVRRAPRDRYVRRARVLAQGGAKTIPKHHR